MNHSRTAFQSEAVCGINMITSQNRPPASLKAALILLCLALCASLHAQMTLVQYTGHVSLKFVLPSPLTPNVVSNRYWDGVFQGNGNTLAIISWESTGASQAAGDSLAVGFETDAKGLPIDASWAAEHIADADEWIYGLDPNVGDYTDTYNGLIWKYTYFNSKGSWSVQTLGGQTGNPGAHDGQPSVGEPINVATGNVYQEVTDYESQGPNKLRFARTYNSLLAPDTASSMLGGHWASTFDRSIRIASPTLVYLSREDGQEVEFALNGSSWKCASDLDLALSQSGDTWTLTDERDEIDIFKTDSAGSTARLSQIRARNGYTQTIHPDASGFPETVTDSYGRNLIFTYSDGVLQTLQTPDGQTFSYSFDTATDLLGATAVSQPRLRGITYSTIPSTGISYNYASSGNDFSLSSIEDENGSTYLSWTYDKLGRGLSSQIGNGAMLTEIAYDDSSGARTVTLPLGEKDTYHCSPINGALRVTEIDRTDPSTNKVQSESFAYDSNGYESSRTDWNGNTTLETKDALGRPTSVIEAIGSPVQRTERISYFGSFHLPSMIIRPGLTISNDYDNSGNLLTHSERDTTVRALPYSTNGQVRTWKYMWKDGLLIEEQAPRTDVKAQTTYSYDSSGTLVQTTDALGHSKLVLKHSPGGLPLWTQDENGVSTRYTYNGRLWKTAEVVNGLETLFNYDHCGELISETLPDASTWDFTYDSAHRCTSEIDPLGQKVTGTYNRDNTLDGLYNLDSNFNIRCGERFTFDSFGRRTSELGGAGQKVSYDYDPEGNVVSMVDGVGNITTRTYDNLGRVSTVSDSFGSSNVTYDDKDHPLTVQTANGSLTEFIYDGFGEFIETISPDQGTTISVYDGDGNVVRNTDGSGHLVDLTYDPLDRLTSETFPSDPSENISYGYDFGSFGVGRLTSVTDQAGQFAKSYDFRGKVVKEGRINVYGNSETTYVRDQIGRVNTVTYPSGIVTSYSRDAAGQVIQVKLATSSNQQAISVASGIDYLPFGPRLSTTYGNGIKEQRTFDTSYRLVTSQDIGLTPLFSLVYQYDGADDVTHVKSGSTVETLSYGSRLQLDAASGHFGSVSYSYDSNFNRTVASSTVQGITQTSTYNYAGKSNRLLSLGSGANAQSIEYTGAGNIADDGEGRKYTYNEENRLASVKAGIVLIGSYQYDYLGRRLSKVTGSGVKTFVYDSRGLLLEEGADATSSNADYLYLEDGTPFAVYFPATGAVDYLLTDRTGTPQEVINSAQQVVWAAAYKPFGETSTTGSVTMNLRFPGQYYDPETGLNHNGFRDYAPALGRYIESDSIGLLGGPNTYCYAKDSPLKWTDPLGLCSTNSKPNWLGDTPELVPSLWDLADKALEIAELEPLRLPLQVFHADYLLYENRGQIVTNMVGYLNQVEYEEQLRWEREHVDASIYGWRGWR